MRIAILIAGLMLVGLSARADSPNLDGWDRILGERVKSTTIDGVSLMGFDYSGLNRARTPFDQLVSRLARFDPAKLKNRNEKLAFWINAYNIAAVKMVLDHPQVESLNEVGPLPGAVWKMDALKIGGKSYSLDAIENQILRKLGEPRMHFAIVCASVSCPDIRAEAYRASRLAAQLDDQSRRFLSNNKKGLDFNPGKRQLIVSELFEWFAGDFGNRSDIVDFIANHLQKGRQVPAGWREFGISYFKYSWVLNSVHIETERTQKRTE